MTLASGVYEIELDADGLNVDLSPVLVAAARDMAVYESVVTLVAGMPPDQKRLAIPCIRCSACDCVINPYEGLQGRVADLTANHGWRMDGHRYDNSNRRLDDA